MAGFMSFAPSIALLALAPGISATPCTDIAVAAEGKSEQEAAIAVYAQCRLKRPTAGALLGLDDPERDCHEFTRLYELARHYKQTSFSADEFCSTMQGYSGGFATDGRLGDHGACVSEMEEVLASDEVTGSAEKACRRIEQKTGKAPVACAQLVASLTEAPRTDLLDATQMCDRLVTGSGNGTQGFDEDHFTYSCVQYANNLITNIAKGDQSESAMSAMVDGVLHSCQAHVSSAGSQQFCSDYAGLVRQRAARQTLVKFCDGRYREMQSQPSSKTSMRQEPVATPVAAPTAVAPAAAFHAEQVTPTQSKCISYLSGVESLHLPSGEGLKIVQMDCPKRFGASVEACSEVAQLFAAGNVQDACSKAVPAATPAPEKRADMRGVCERVVSKVTVVGLDGTALERATVDVCASEFATLPAAEQPSKLKIRVGCRFIAKHLNEEQQKSSTVDSVAFCGGLVGTSSAASPPSSAAKKVVTQVVMKAATVGPVVLHEVTRHHTIKRATAIHTPAPQPLEAVEVPATAAPAAGGEVIENAAGQSDLLSSFLDTYDDSAASDTPDAASAPDDSSDALPDQVDVAAPPSGTAAAPTVAAPAQKAANFLASQVKVAPPASTTTTAPRVAVSDDKDVSFLGSFLDQYSDENAPGQSTSEMGTAVPVQATTMDAGVAAPVPSGPQELPEKTSLIQPESGGQADQASTNSVDDVLTSFMDSD